MPVEPQTDNFLNRIPARQTPSSKVDPRAPFRLTGPMFQRPLLSFFATFLSLNALPAEPAEPPEQVAYKIATGVGLQEFHKIERLDFTFNAKIGDETVERSWRWWPRQDRVRYLPDDGSPVDYLRVTISKNSSEEARDIDRNFVNDSYWLLFPFKVVWDDSVTLENIPADDFTSDIRAKGGLKVSYPEGVGYSPGDVYELYYEEHYLIKEWVFRKGGGDTPTRITAWEDYDLVGPLALSLSRPATDGSDFQVWFSEVAVKWAP